MLPLVSIRLNIRLHLLMLLQQIILLLMLPYFRLQLILMLLLVKLRLVLGNPLLLLLLVGLWVLKHRVLLLLLKLRLCSEAVSIAVCLFNFLMVVLFCNFLEVLLLFVSPLFGIFPAFFEGGFGFILSLLCLYMSNKLPGILNSL